MNGLLRAIKARPGHACGLAVLAYADDLVLLADSNADLQAMMDAVLGFCSKWRIELNVKKTEVVVFGRRGNHHSNIVYGSRKIKEVAKYKYLGLLFQDGGWAKQKGKMLRKARRALARWLVARWSVAAT